MGKPPSVIIIARHGARLDAVDKQWHLTSPTPYDPPLTYGGWNQARALGIRIGHLLRAREEPNSSHSSQSSENNSVEDKAAAVGGNDGESNTARKQRIIFHSSPFLRCVQTAIGVSAGMRLSKTSLQSRSLPSPQKHHRMHSGPLVTRGSEFHQLSAIPEPSNDLSLSKLSLEQTDAPIPRYKLRLDAFLGEWLSPDYFEHISPPPGSVMMIASAKAELLRRGDPIEAGIETGGKSVFGHFPGGWSNPFTGDTANRSGSFDTGANGSSKPIGPGISKVPADLPAGNLGYVPPMPTYAISPSDPIPTGYVSHARDACIDVDYQWDSMREPQNWGSGGEYGEEWSSMHSRFRNGLRHMTDWYRSGHLRASDTSKTTPVQEEDATETVLILVTHGAGCNALIGALTGQPVLLDVGMASLTMAVRKDVDKESSITGATDGDTSRRKENTASEELAEEYEMKVVSSTEHLRTATNYSHAPQTASPRIFPTPISSYRHRFEPTSSSTASQETFIIEDSMSRRLSNSKISDPVYSHGASSCKSSPGLWGSVSPALLPTSCEASEAAEDLVPNFEDPKPSLTDNALQDVTADQRPPLPSSSRSLSQHGLWGSVSLPEREPPGKRRWTVSERNPCQ
ncbi:hypothetical protein ACJ72_04734 [Emergomyces africanus]|uniref:Phosphoglycerate mutase n=1 Tax=Emergomyces africanus TaxID=1955775 RepID=A0A1B7NWD4_9EURO|nr:hypothetical protein ACJ72_04734 [Emergomyces africanus]